jgi:hypothetical protein
MGTEQVWSVAQQLWSGIFDPPTGESFLLIAP